MATETLQLLGFLKIPKLNRPNAMALVSALIAALPKEPNPSVQKAGAELRSVAATFQQQWAERARAESEEGTDSVYWDRELDPAWCTLDDRLASYATLPPDQYPLAVRAGEIRATLLPEGRAFLRLPYTQEWAFSDTLLKRIDDEKLAADIDKLAGPEFLAAVRYAHQRYGEALGKTSPLPAGPKANLLDQLQQLSETIRAYALQVVASTEGDQPLSMEAARQALRPIEDLRAEISRRSRSAKPAQPVPPNEPVES